MFRAVIAVMQLMISAQAGLVNYIEGPVNVQLHQQVSAGMPIQTGPQGHAEILLNPGSFLRLGENSTVVLDSVELTQIAIRVVNGAAMIESAELDKQAPIRVTTGNLRTLIVSPGLYRFSDDTASVVDGKLRTADSSATVKKGQQITAIGDRYEKRKVTVTTAAIELDEWSARRSSELARANALAYRDRSTAGLLSYGAFPYPYWGLFPNRSAWLYSFPLNGFTLIPRRSYQSHWGYRFAPALAFGGSIFAGTTRGSGRTTARPVSPPTGGKIGGSVGRSRGSGGARSRGFGGGRR